MRLTGRRDYVGLLLTLNRARPRKANLAVGAAAELVLLHDAGLAVAAPVCVTGTVPERGRPVVAYK